MAEADWTVMTNSLDINSVDRGVTSGITPPTGGGTFVYGFNSLVVAAGGVGLFANQASFAPMAKGGSVRGAIKRGASGGTTGWSPYLFIGANDTDMNAAIGYMVGLQDDDPSRIVLVKGQLNLGLPAGTPDPVNNGILRQSNDSVAIDEWRHLRLDMIVNGNGDVILKVFESVLGDVTAPSWATVAGMTDFVDDTLQVNTGSAPLTSGRGGKGVGIKDVTRRSFFDQVEVARQL